MSLTAAIRQLQAEVDDFRQGTVSAPKEGTQEWWVLRAKSLSLSTLKRADQLALGSSPQQAERFFGSCSRQLKHDVEA